MFVFFLAPFVHPAWAKPMVAVYFGWALIELVRLLAGRRKPLAFRCFGRILNDYIRPGGIGR